MRRREFIALLGGVAAWPLAAHAQQGDRIRRIGVLLPAAADDPQFQTWVGAFLQGLGKAGWTIGRNVRIDTRWATTAAAEIRSLKLIILLGCILLMLGIIADKLK